MKTESVGRFRHRGAQAAGFLGILSVSAALAAPLPDDAEARARENWSETIVRTPVPDEGCFMAEYPSTAWMPVGCVKAPDVAYVPRTGAGARTVGDGNDYVARVTGLLSKTVGSFPVVTGVTNETGALGANDYSLELNSNFMVTAACRGHKRCSAWQEFIYSSGSQSVFMSYQLLSYGLFCPAGWTAVHRDCFRNSAAVTAPQLPIGDLSGMKLSGSAVAGKRDTVVFTGAGMAYSVSGRDDVVDLASAWQQSEFNVFGDGNDSAADFNPGSRIVVKVAVTDGSSSAPTCTANSGTFAETNNLHLHATCEAVAGTSPHIQFVESN